MAARVIQFEYETWSPVGGDVIKDFGTFRSLAVGCMALGIGLGSFTVLSVSGEEIQCHQPASCSCYHTFLALCCVWQTSVFAVDHADSR